MCIYTEKQSTVDGEFFIIQDRIFYTAGIDGVHAIATVDLNGENYYTITSVEQNCHGCHYSNGWIYSYSAGDGRLVRFRTDGSEYEYVGGEELRTARYCVSNAKIAYAVIDNGSTIVKLYDTETNVTSTLKTVDGEYVRFYGFYGDYLLFETDGVYSQHMCDLQRGSTYSFCNGKNEMTIWNDQLFMCDQEGNAEFRSLSDPMTVTQQFKLPTELLRSRKGYVSIVLPVGSNLAYVTDGERDDVIREVIIVNRNLETVTSFAVCKE